MSSNVQNNVPYLPTTRKFPIDDPIFENEMSKIYTDIATAVNNRIISIFDLSPIITGEQWFTNATQGNSVQKRQTFRRVYSIGSIAAGATSTTAHGITTLSAFTRIYGAAVTATVDYRPIPYASVTNVNQQIEIRCDSVNITVVNGAAAPNITSATVVLEWLAN